MKRSKIAIIGGGAAGLFAAALLSDLNVDISIVEKNNKLGKKILASGNGKCNFSNIGDLNNKYNNDFANIIINKFSVKRTLDEFTRFGLIYKSDNQGRCYPVSESSTSVLDCLKNSLNKVNIVLDSTVTDILIKDNIYELCYNQNIVEFDYIICCSGSKASNLGSDKAYLYLKNLDLHIEEYRSSLVPIIINENVSELSGVRVKCVIKLVNEKDVIEYIEKGEVIFKDNGLSGIAIFNASSYLKCSPKGYRIKLDLSNGMDDVQLKSYLKKKKAKSLFAGFLNDKLGNYILNKNNIHNYSNLTDQILDNLITDIKDLTFTLNDFYPLKDAQVCRGGVSLNEVNENLELLKYPNIYIAGELLDIDGICGGFNLQFAWSSAGVIASDIKEKLRDKYEK